MERSPKSANRSGTSIFPRGPYNCPIGTQTEKSHVKVTSSGEVAIGNAPKMEIAFPFWMATSICCLVVVVIVVVVSGEFVLRLILRQSEDSEVLFQAYAEAIPHSEEGTFQTQQICVWNSLCFNRPIFRW